MSERDPRVNPEAGDILQKKYQGRLFEARAYNERTVDEVDCNRVTYVGNNVCSPTISLKSWRRWAKDAKVITPDWLVRQRQKQGQKAKENVITDTGMRFEEGT